MDNVSVTGVDVREAREYLESVVFDMTVTLSDEGRRQNFYFDIEVQVPQEDIMSGVNGTPGKSSRGDIIYLLEEIEDSIDPIMTEKKRKDLQSEIHAVRKLLKKDIEKDNVEE